MSIFESFSYAPFGLGTTVGLLVGWAWLNLAMWLRFGPTDRHPWQLSAVFGGVGLGIGLASISGFVGSPPWIAILGLLILLVTGLSGAIWITRHFAGLADLQQEAIAAEQRAREAERRCDAAWREERRLERLPMSEEQEFFAAVPEDETDDEDDEDEQDDD